MANTQSYNCLNNELKKKLNTKNMHLKHIIRSLFRQKLNSGIIIISLSVAMACINLIVLFINREMNTDGFHKNSAQIYSLNCDDPFTVGGKMNQCREGSAEYMTDNFSQVEQFCRVKNATPQKVVVNNESYFDKPITIATSKNFFNFFSYQLLTKNPKTALETEGDLVISEVLAKKYFGTSDPIGKPIILSYRDQEDQMVVSGVFRKPIDNTQLKFDMVRLANEGDSRCFVQLSADAKPQALEAIFKANKASIPVIHGGTPGQYYLEPLKENYFETNRKASMEASRDKTDLWITLAIGLLILGIGSFNYLGLLNNKLLEKTREYAIRKVNGGSKWGFTVHFLIESLITVGISFVLSIILMLWIAPFFNNLINTSITANIIFQPLQWIMYLSLVVFLLLITFLFVLYRIRSAINIELLKPSSQRIGKSFQLPAFNIFQLAGSIVLIACSIIIIKQINYITNKPIGLDKEVLEVKIPGSYAHIASVFKEELLKEASIMTVSRAGSSPVLEHFLVLLKYKQNGVEKQFTPAGFSGDENYISTLGVQLIEGSDFSGNPASDKDKILINESLAKLFPNQNLIGMGLPGMEEKIVSGIVKDFHYSNLKSVVEAGFIGFDANGQHIMVKALENQMGQANEAIAQIWAKLIPDYPLNLETIGERYKWMHRENKNYMKLVSACCCISIFLSMMGLFAISFQTSQYRTKEIGIRKVNGARISEVLLMLNKDFVEWVAISFVIATPIAYYAMNKWLQNFAYKTELSWWIFALAGLLALGIALLTVSWQSWRAARRNPVEALRYE
jgi:putative ABC transport system permease protein